MEQVQVGEQGLAGAASEEAADFARVQAMAAAVEPVPVAGAVVESEPEAERMDAVESLTGLLSMVNAGASIAGFSRTAAVWTPEACGRVAGATVPVLRKYPWGARILDFLETGTGAEEVALVLACAPLVKATVGAVKADMAGGEPAPASAPAAAAPGATVTVSAPADLGELVEVHGRAN